MKIHELYCPPGAYGVTKPQTQLHWLLSPSQSSFPKGNNTCPKSPPAMASSLNLQLPRADSKSQKRTDFSRERWERWMRAPPCTGWKPLCRKANEVSWKGGRGGGAKTPQPQAFPRQGRDLKNVLYPECSQESMKELLGFASDFIICFLISWAGDRH